MSTDTGISNIAVDINNIGVATEKEKTALNGVHRHF